MYDAPDHAILLCTTAAFNSFDDAICEQGESRKVTRLLVSSDATCNPKAVQGSCVLAFAPAQPMQLVSSKC
jgi:hypothetical protein